MSLISNRGRRWERLPRLPKRRKTSSLFMPRTMPQRRRSSTGAECYNQCYSRPSCCSGLVIRFQGNWRWAQVLGMRNAYSRTCLSPCLQKKKHCRGSLSLSVAGFRLYNCVVWRILYWAKLLKKSRLVWTKSSSLRNETLLIASCGYSCSDITILLTSAIFDRLSFFQSSSQPILSFNMAFSSNAVGWSGISN